jgi:hypothetical protein
LLIKNADTVTELNQPAMLIQDKDADFELDDKILLNTNTITKQVNTLVPPNASSEPTETPSDDASQADRLLLEPATFVSED